MKLCFQSITAKIFNSTKLKIRHLTPRKAFYGTPNWVFFWIKTHKAFLIALKIIYKKNRTFSSARLKMWNKIPFMIIELN
ncbi:CLUMA_CG007159, isoform A [Clunio marinus]|uniref:CLUMA_CG007159, isoform A n=1 Tax=Clunio marinus TaxID=568069 RepID=A0A1J1I036_9DIPT|nr:CLUMA_CG007159, isoform A [Clunio marinus]